MSNRNADVVPLIVENDEKFDEINTKSFLRFDNIKLSILDSEKRDKFILDGVCGTAFSSEIYGIVGASGGGKTSLLSILSGRIGIIPSSSKYSILGNVQLNDTLIDCSNIKNLEYLKRSTSFVPQQDVLIPTELTKEAIELSALLKLPKTMNKQQKISKAHEIISALDLISCSETKIGGEKIRGISGGERKRVSIGIQLVTDRNILILDEPISGLDSAIAFETILLLKKLANSGKIVIISIHQPSAQIFSKLDRVLILTNGMVTYEGKVSILPKYLINIGYQCPQHCNISDFTLQKISTDYHVFVTKWNQHSIDSKKTMNMNMSSSSSFIVDKNEEMNPICFQASILITRQFSIFKRDKIPTFLRLIQTICVAIIIGILWWQLTPINDISYYGDTDDELQKNNKMIANLNNRFGAIFFSSTFAAMNAIMTTNLIFPAQRLVFEKERADNWYYTTVWIFSKSCIDFPVTGLILLPFSIIVKYMINFDAQFYEIYLILTLIALVADSMGFLLGCIAKRPEIAMQLSTVTILPLFLFSNFFISNNTIPQWIGWIQWIDCFFYGTEALAIYEFEGQQSNDQQPIDVGNHFLNSLNINPNNKIRDIYCLISLVVGFRIIAIFWLIGKNGI